MTPDTQAPGAARDGFVTYDELAAPDLDHARWTPARLPLPTGREHVPLDPGAEVHQRADRGSLAYRRWLKDRGIRYGTSLNDPGGSP